MAAHLLGHEGNGSLRSYLVSCGLANEVQAAVSADISDVQLMEVAIDVTEAGLRQRDKVVDAIFSYISMLVDQGVPQYIYDEVLQLSRIAFRFAEKGDPAPYVSSIVADMQRFVRPAEYLVGPRLVLEADDGDFARYVSRLTPSRAIVKVQYRLYSEHN